MDTTLSFFFLRKECSFNLLLIYAATQLLHFVYFFSFVCFLTLVLIKKHIVFFNAADNISVQKMLVEVMSDFSGTDQYSGTDGYRYTGQADAAGPHVVSVFTIPAQLVNTVL